MSFTQPTNWKHLGRHPLSLKYEDLPPAEFANMVKGVREFGIIDERKVALVESEGVYLVADGWQLLQACITVDVKPEFSLVKLKKGITLEQFVMIKNDNRRHETPEQAARRVKQRLTDVAEKLSAGMSKKAIAESEGVSPKQIRKDIETITGGTGPPCVNTYGEVTGRDGKQHATLKTVIVESPAVDKAVYDEVLANPVEDKKKAKAKKTLKQKSLEILGELEQQLNRPQGTVSIFAIRKTVAKLRSSLSKVFSKGE